MRKPIMIAVVLTLAAAVLPARAADGPMVNMELLGTIPIAEPTHFEFLVREVGGVTRTFALVGSRNSRNPNNGGVHIVDVTDPGSPFVVAAVPCAQRNNDPQVSPDGTLLILTSDGGSGFGCRAPAPHPGYIQRVRDIAVVDITDIENPVLKGSPGTSPTYTLPSFRGVHTAVWHPTRPILYLSNQETPSRGPFMGIVDFSGPVPVGRVAPMPPVGIGPHDTTFNAAGTRAYVAAVTAGYILDTTDPLNPTLVTVIADPTVNIYHEMFLAPGERYLFVVDEQTGAIVNAACPGGGVHVYDLRRDERTPTLIGTFWAGDVRPLPEPDDPSELPACTAHEGSFSPDGTRFSIGWYSAGTRVFDTSALVGPDARPDPVAGVWVREVGSGVLAPASHAWAAKMHPSVPGYVFATEQSVGLVVYRLSGAAAG